MNIIINRKRHSQERYEYLSEDRRLFEENKRMRGVKLKFTRYLMSCSCSRWSCWSHWRTWLTVVVIITYTIVLLVVLPLMIFGLYAVDAEATFSAWFIGGLFTLLTIPIFLANLLQHLYNYTQPHLQAYIVRVIWMVPVYSIDSWLGLRFPDFAIHWSIVRECYESYALYNFLVYLLNFMESEYDLTEVMEPRPPVKHLVPCCCCKPWPGGRRFIRWNKVGVLQYAILRPILTVIALITQLAGVYDEGKIKPDGSYIYISILNAISQGLALYSLAYFYKGTRDLLKPLNPLLKFTAIKLIIVITFWQAVIIAILVKANVIKQSEALDKYGFKDVAVSMQDFLICIEMLAFAIAFYFFFSHKPYIDRAAAQVPCLHSCFKMVDVRDIYGDIKENFVDPIPVPRIPNRLPGRWNRGREGPEEREDVPLLNSELQTELKKEEDNNRNRAALEREGRGMESLMIVSMKEVPVEATANNGVRLSPVHQSDHEDETNSCISSSSSHSSSSSDSNVRERRQAASDPADGSQ